MKLLGPPSACGCENAATQNFNFYTPPSIETSEDGFLKETLLPINNIEDEVIEFQIPSYEDSFICMESICLNAVLKTSVVNDDGELADLTNEDDVTVCNETISAIWRSIVVKLNGVDICGSGAFWPAYKSYNEDFFSLPYFTYDFGPQVTKLLYRDDFTDATAKGHKLRKLHTVNGVTAVSGRLPIDFFRSKNYLTPGNRIDIVLRKNSSDFFTESLTPTKNYITKIQSLNLNLRRIKMVPQLQNQISSTKPQLYPCVYSEVRPILVSQNSKHFVARISTNSIMPKQIVMTFVKTSTFNGNQKGYVTYYDSADVERVNLRLDNVHKPNEVLEVDWDRHMSRYICNLYRNCGKLKQGVLPVKKEFFKNGYAFFVFDLRPDKCNGKHLHPGRVGTLDAEFHFKKGLDENYFLLLHCFYDQIIVIDPVSGIPEREIF